MISILIDTKTGVVYMCRGLHKKSDQWFYADDYRVLGVCYAPNADKSDDWLGALGIWPRESSIVYHYPS